MVILRKLKRMEVRRMNEVAMLTGVKVDTAMYYTRVVTFKFASNGIGMSFFRQFKNIA